MSRIGVFQFSGFAIEEVLVVRHPLATINVVVDDVDPSSTLLEEPDRGIVANSNVPTSGNWNSGVEWNF